MQHWFERPVAKTLPCIVFSFVLTSKFVASYLVVVARWWFRLTFKTNIFLRLQYYNSFSTSSCLVSNTCIWYITLETEEVRVKHKWPDKTMSVLQCKPAKLSTHTRVYLWNSGEPDVHIPDACIIRLSITRWPSIYRSVLWVPWPTYGLSRLRTEWLRLSIWPTYRGCSLQEGSNNRELCVWIMISLTYLQASAQCSGYRRIHTYMRKVRKRPCWFDSLLHLNGISGSANSRGALTYYLA